MTGKNFNRAGSGKPQAYSPETTVEMMRRSLARILFKNRFLPLCSAAFFICGLLILGGRFLLSDWNQSGSLILACAALLAA